MEEMTNIQKPESGSAAALSASRKGEAESQADAELQAGRTDSAAAQSDASAEAGQKNDQDSGGSQNNSPVYQQEVPPQSQRVQPPQQEVPPQPQQAQSPQQEVPPQPQQGQQAQQLPPGYVIDPATGQAVFVGFPGYQQAVYPGYQQPVYYAPPQPTPEQIAAQQAAEQQRYGQIVQSMESFLAGETTVADVVKSLYTTTAQDDQLWKGILVGAAAAVVLTNGPVREAMGKTFGGIFPGTREKTAASAAGSKTSEQDADSTTSSTDTKE